MGSFTFISYTGEDSGQVLVRMLEDGPPNSDEVHEVETETETAPTRRIGFMPNEPEPDEVEPEDPEEDPEEEEEEYEQSNIQRRPLSGRASSNGDTVG